MMALRRRNFSIAQSVTAAPGRFAFHNSPSCLIVEPQAWASRVLEWSPAGLPWSLPIPVKTRIIRSEFRLIDLSAAAMEVAREENRLAKDPWRNEYRQHFELKNYFIAKGVTLDPQGFNISYDDDEDMLLARSLRPGLGGLHWVPGYLPWRLPMPSPGEAA